MVRLCVRPTIFLGEGLRRARPTRRSSSIVTTFVSWVESQKYRSSRKYHSVRTVFNFITSFLVYVNCRKD